METHLSQAKLPIMGSSRRKETQRFVKFSIVGALGAVTDFTILNLLIVFAGFSSSIANSFGFCAAVLQNFLLNRWWTYPESRIQNTRRQMAKFALVSVVGLGINKIVFEYFDELLRPFWVDWLTSADLGFTVSYNSAKLFAIGVVLFWNFAANRLWTFKGL
ncbi:MAG: GtrA family protein [Caldilineaceae bacterium SB0661_bin_32]|uniref:GtrA family protein n=1 Tax=Caldilineaceae bacterium SB0661_bin_32 TaxID=2605255 RepID=A0A6B1D3W8_9CHLR|nr:GtrA family protein [Caldilineaceae bacterium SB0661_bin_32]